MPRPLIRALALTAVVLCPPLGCSTATNHLDRPAPEVQYDTLFVDPDHHADWCLKSLAATFRDMPDGTIFFDRDTKLRIKVPAGEGKEPYHAHLYHRLKGEDRLVEHLAVQGKNGAIEVDLSQFSQPEILIVTSASMKMRERKPDSDARRSNLILAPYAMGFRLVDRAQAGHLVSLQPFRYEWKHPGGTASLLVQSFNRSDMLLTLYDAEGTADYLFSDGYYHWRGGDAYLTPRVVIDASNAKGVYQRTGTYAAAESAWAEASKGAGPFSLRFMGQELLAFAPPARVELTLPDEKPATSAVVSARFEGVRATSPVQFVLAAGYPIGSNDKVGVRVQSHAVTAEKKEGNYVIALDDLDPVNFPMPGYLAHRLVETWRNTGGFYRPCEPLGRSEAPLQAPSNDEVGKLHAKILLPRYASHYDVMFWFGAGSGENEAKKFLFAYYSATTPGTGGPGTGGTPDPSPSTTILPPPWPGGPGGPGTGPGTGPDTGGPGTGPGTGPGSGSGTTTPSGGSGSGTGSSSSLSPFLGLFLGPSGPPPPPGPQEPGTIEITIKCGCGMVAPGAAMNTCTCGKHMWHLGQILQGIQQAAASSVPQGFTLADTAWFGSHGASAPCHTWTQIGMARISYWGSGFQLVHVWYRVKIIFAPCKGLGADPKDKNDKKLGKIGDDDPDNPGNPRPNYGYVAVFGEPRDGQPLGRITQLAGGIASPNGSDIAWNPSSDPNAAVHMTDLVTSFRRALRMSDLPLPIGSTWTAPTRLFSFTPTELAEKAAAFTDWQKEMRTAYWSRSEKRSALASPELGDVLSDWAVYSVGSRSSASQGSGGGGNPYFQH